MQHEITTVRPLLDSRGVLLEPGYSKGLLPQYSRSAIKGGALRIKEWDYYLITCDDFAVALTIADNSYMGLDSISLLDFRIPWEHTTSPMSFLTLGKRNFPSSSASGNVKSGGRHHKISFELHGDYRLLTFHMDKFFDGKPIDGEIRLENPPQESMVIVTPFRKKDRFLFESKDQLHACLRRGTF